MAKDTGVDIERVGASEERGTPERRRHDPVGETDVVMRDADGVTVRRVYLAKDTLDRLLQRGDITLGQADAGRKFQRAFHTAGLDALRAADMTRIPGGAGGGADAMQDARERIARAIWALGGYNTPVANAAWDVIGGGMTLDAFAKRQAFGMGRKLNANVAKGLLVGALAIIEGLTCFDRKE